MNRGANSLMEMASQLVSLKFFGSFDDEINNALNFFWACGVSRSNAHDCFPFLLMMGGTKAPPFDSTIPFCSLSCFP